MDTQNTIRFDWALKRLLRNKANFKVLEGFLSELLREDVIVVNIAESEGNQDSANDKYNRVDILVENSNHELIIIELQNNSKADYFWRMQYGVSRVITNYMSLGNKYDKVRKVYSVNIVYFEIGQGKDYVYHGLNEFRGIHENDILQLSENQKNYFGTETVSAIFPEYYIIKVNDFDDVAKDSLDEWIYYLKNDEIRDEFKAKGLTEAREILKVDRLSEQEKKAYYYHIEGMIHDESVIDTALYNGEFKAYYHVILTGFKKGLDIDMLQELTGYKRKQIERILKDKGLIK